MPDTGAPWNIPYVAASDLVKDWPTDNQSMAEAIADALDIAGVGIGTNCQSTTKTDTFTLSNPGAGSTAAITGLSVTITPSSATNKVLIIAQIAMTADGGFGNGGHLLLKRGASPICIGDAAGSRVRRTSGGGEYDTAAPGSSSILFLDSPATTSATTYSIEAGLLNGTQTAYINRSRNDTNNSNYARYTSTITAIEVAV